MKGTVEDPRGLIQDAYRIEGITAGECRSIFLDWALGVPAGEDAKELVQRLLTQNAEQPVDHPMTLTLTAALAEQSAPKRRGGRAGRSRD